MKKITKNELKDLAKLKQKKYRKLKKKVIVEGWRTLDQLFRGKVKIEKILISEQNELDRIPIHYRSKCFLVNENNIRNLTETKHPQSVLAIISSETKAICSDNYLAYLDGIKDPGNLGTIIRTAAAAGLDGLILSPDCCELFNEKVIRSAMGLTFTFPIEIKDYEWFKNCANQKIVTTLDEAISIYEAKISKEKIILVIGSEAHGVSAEILAIADTRIKIPQFNDVESLNAAIAAGVCFFEFKRRLI